MAEVVNNSMAFDLCFWRRVGLTFFRQSKFWVFTCISITTSFIWISLVLKTGMVTWFCLASLADARKNPECTLDEKMLGCALAASSKPEVKSHWIVYNFSHKCQNKVFKQIVTPTKGTAWDRSTIHAWCIKCLRCSEFQRFRKSTENKLSDACWVAWG